MEQTIMNVRILVKAESALIKANANRVAARTRLFAMMIGLVLLTIIMLNVAAYQYLSEIYSAAAAALLVSLSNALLAIAVMIAAVRIKPGPEVAMVQDIRDMALTELSGDINAAKESIEQFGDDVGRIRSRVNSTVDVFKSGNSSLGALGPALGLITTMLKK